FVLQDPLDQADIGNQPLGAGRNRNITVRELLDRAAQGIEAKFKGQEATEAAIRATLGNAYRALGEYPQALKHQERCRALLEHKLGADNLDTIRSTNDLGSLYLRAGRYDEAAPL